jgi:hypothetical protein
MLVSRNGPDLLTGRRIVFSDREIGQLSLDFGPDRRKSPSDDPFRVGRAWGGRDASTLVEGSAAVLPVLAMSVVAAERVTRAADSTCFPTPLPDELRLQFTPQPQTDASVGCVPPLPCVAANPPNLAEWPTQRPQELKLTATSAEAVSGYKYIELWQQEWDTATSAWNAGTVIESSDAVERANTSTNTATYGLSGLKPGVRYGHRVAWCRLTGSVKTCNCFDDTPTYLDVDSDGTPDARPTTFATPPLAVPSGLTAAPKISSSDRRPTRSASEALATPCSAGMGSVREPGPTIWGATH